MSDRALAGVCGCPRMTVKGFFSSSATRVLQICGCEHRCSSPRSALPSSHAIGRKRRNVKPTSVPHELTNKPTLPPQTHRYGLGIRFLREEYASSYAKLDLPLPLPVGGDPDTELSTGPQDGLPIYASTPSSQEERMDALRDRGGECALCAESFLAGENLMLCYHCGAATHVRCLADRMLREAGADASEVIPSEGSCWAPACARRLLWSRLVKGVQVYRLTVSPSGAPEDEARGGDGDGGGGASIGDGPLVWRVDDSSGDEEEDEEEGGGGDDSDCDSERSAMREDGGRGGWSSGAASKDLVSSNADRGAGKEVEEEEEDDDDDDDGFWDLGEGRCSQAKRGGGQGGSGQARRVPPCGGGSARRGRQTSASLAVGRQGVEKSPPCDGQHVSLVESASERHDSDSGSSSGGDGDQDGDAEKSPPRLPLAERLRLRRLGGK